MAIETSLDREMCIRDSEVIAQAEDELRKLAMPIKEACMTPAVKRLSLIHI